LKCKYRDHALFTIHANSSTTQCGIGVVKKGELIVHRDRADEVLEIFRELLVARFPIQQIRFIDDFGGDDNASMSDNNSSALCVRPVTGTSNRWSQHSYGTAIDINPLVNPYVKGYAWYLLFLLMKINNFGMTIGAERLSFQRQGVLLRIVWGRMYLE